MKRRDFLKGLALAPVAASLPADAIVATPYAHQEISLGYLITDVSGATEAVSEAIYYPHYNANAINDMFREVMQKMNDEMFLEENNQHLLNLLEKSA